jgi:hypothetical protein
MVVALLEMPVATPSVRADEVITSSSGLTIVPFAIPVAVPVAIVQQPTLFYGVSRFAPLPTTVETPPPSPSDVVATSTSAVAEPLRDQVAAILKRKCAECHQGPTSRGELSLFDEAGQLELKLPRHRIVEATESHAELAPAMPPAGREPLSAGEWQRLKEWARLPKSFAY